METDRTKNRRELREKRLAYFDKYSPAEPPAVSPGQQQAPCGNDLTESSPINSKKSFQRDPSHHLTAGDSHRSSQPAVIPTLETGGVYKASPTDVGRLGNPKKSGRKEKNKKSQTSRSQGSGEQYPFLQNSWKGLDANLASLSVQSNQTVTNYGRKATQSSTYAQHDVDNRVRNPAEVDNPNRRAPSSPRRIGIANGGHKFSLAGKGKSQLTYLNSFEMGPGARPKVRPGQDAVDGCNPRVARQQRNPLRNTYDLTESVQEQEEITVVSRDVFEANFRRHGSSPSDRLEVDESRPMSEFLQPVSVPTVIHSHHGHYRMGTKERQPAVVSRDDLYEVYKLERRYDYPRGRNIGMRDSYEDARMAATEHNAFGVDSMLNEMRQVRRVKSQLHEELRHSFDKFGSVAGILGSGKDYVCDPEGESRVGEGWEEDEQLEQEEMRLSEDGSEFVVEQINRPETQEKVEQTSRTSGNVDENENELTKWGWEEASEMSSIDARDSDRVNQINGCSKVDSALTVTRADVPKDVADDVFPTGFDLKKGQELDTEKIDERQRTSTVENGDVSISPGDEGRDGSDEEKDDFNLGALCAAAKQGDDILKDYIRRLTKRILNKNEAESDGDRPEQNAGVSSKKVEHPRRGHDTGVKEHGMQEGPRYLEDPVVVDDENNHSRSFEKGNVENKIGVMQSTDLEGFSYLGLGAGSASKNHGEYKPLYPSSSGLEGEILKRVGPDTDVQIAAASYERLDQMGYFMTKGLLQNDVSLTLEEVRVGDSDLEGDRGRVRDVENFERHLGFETHRPMDRAHSPLKVVRFIETHDSDRSEPDESGGTFVPENSSGEGAFDGSKGHVDDYLVNGHSDVLLNGAGIQQDDQVTLIRGMDRVGSDPGRYTVNSTRPLNSSGTDSGNITGAGENGDGLTHVDFSSSIHQERREEIGGHHSRSSRRPRTPEEHKRGVERHHQWGKRRESLEESPWEVNAETEGDTDQPSLRLNLSAIDQSEERNGDAFITEVSSDWMLDESMNSNEGFRLDSAVVRDNENGMDDDDESVLMRKISDFNPASHEDVSVTGNGGRIPNGVSTVGSPDGNGSRNSAFRPGFATTHNSNGNVEPQDCIPSERQSESERRDLKSTGLLKNGRRKKSRDVRDVPSKVQTGSTSQYKSRWPLSSSLIPSRPSRTNPRRFSPERKMDRRVRPASAKVTRGGGGSKEDAMKGQRSRPKSAVSEKKSKEPDAGGDFFQVRSSMMFDGSVNRSSTTGPLTLQLISDSPRERRTLSIWQLLPDEILLTIFSHLKPSDLLACSLTCQGFYRVAMDESLWKVIRLEKKLLTDFYLTQIGLKHPSRVIFSQCQGKTVTENGLRNLFRTCVDSLQELNFSGCTGEMFSGDSVLLHASRCYNLSSIDASWCNVTDNGLNAVTGGANRLSSVCLNGCQSVTDTGLRSLVERHGSSLIEFEVFGCIDLSPLTLTRIGDVCKNLHSLNIGQCYKVTFESLFEVIPKLKALRHLDVRGCKQMRDDCVRKIAKCCKRLETLVMANCNFISNVSMVDIAANLKTIRSLDVSGCKKITNEGVRSVAMCCTRLEAFNLSSTSIDRKSISTLASYCSQNLRDLKLNCCKDITEASIVKLLKHCRSLETLHLYGVKGLRNLGLLKLQYPCLMYE